MGVFDIDIVCDLVTVEHFETVRETVILFDRVCVRLTDVVGLVEAE